MKNFLIALTMILVAICSPPSTAYAQDLTASMIGVPQTLFDATKNLVMETQHTGGFIAENKYVKMSAAEWKPINDKYKADLRSSKINGTPRPAVPSRYYWKTSFKPTSTDERFGAYALNYVHDMIWEFGYQYEGLIAGKHTLHRFSPLYQAADGNLYSDFDIYVYISSNADGSWHISSTNELPKYIFEVPDPANTVKLPNGSFHTPMKKVQFTEQQIATSLGWTVKQVQDWDYDYRKAIQRDPSKYITSVFPRFSSDGQTLTTYISGKSHKNVILSSLISNNGKPINYSIEMMALNNCSRPSTAVDAESEGNFGECKDQWYNTEAEAETFSYDFDYTRNDAVTVFAVEIASPSGFTNGHYERWHAYYNHKLGRPIQSSFDR